MEKPKKILCAACKKPMDKYDSWNYVPPSGNTEQRIPYKIFSNLCAECATYICEVKFK